MYCYVALNCPIGMHYQLVLNWYLHQPKSHQLSFNKGTEIPGPIDWTPGIPGFDKKDYIFLKRCIKDAQNHKLYFGHIWMWYCSKQMFIWLVFVTSKNLFMQLYPWVLCKSIQGNHGAGQPERSILNAWCLWLPQSLPAGDNGLT